MEQQAPGSVILGGGTVFIPETGPLSCDIEVELVGDSQRMLWFVIDVLERLGAPVGSWAQIGDEAPIPFGVTHGLALSLDGVSLPREVYEQNDINTMIGALTSELDGDAELHSWWDGPERTNLYFYVREPEQLRSVLPTVQAFGKDFDLIAEVTGQPVDSLALL